jgi:two-component system, cell cycle response regulator
LSRILIVDDSLAIRALLGDKLRKAGYEVVEVADGIEGAQKALEVAPDVVITDFWMPGISGLQLCRLLRAEKATQNVPVVLLTATEDRKTRFWARNAGAAAFVNKTQLGDIGKVVEQVLSEGAFMNFDEVDVEGLQLHGAVQERLSQLLDHLLFDSVVAGQVRQLAGNVAEFDDFFRALTEVASEIMTYRWFGLSLTEERKCLIHTHPSIQEEAVQEAREAFGLPADVSIELVTGEQPAATKVHRTIVQPVMHSFAPIGCVALGTDRKHSSAEDDRFVRIVARELPVPLELMRAMKRATTLASTDGLTGLMNRRAFIEQMEVERSRAERSGFSTAVLLLDIDHFKKVNDTMGHAAGDAILKGVAAVLKRFGRKSDYVARWGGEEFIVALTQTPVAGARIAGERLRRAIEAAVHDLPEGGTHQVTASIGLAVATGSWKLDAVVAKADEALYVAKSRGRNRVELADLGDPNG